MYPEVTKVTSDKSHKSQSHKSQLIFKLQICEWCLGKWDKKNPRMASQLSRIVDYEYFLEFNITHNNVESMNVCTKVIFFFKYELSNLQNRLFKKQKISSPFFTPPLKVQFLSVSSAKIKMPAHQSQTSFSCIFFS